MKRIFSVAADSSGEAWRAVDGHYEGAAGADRVRIAVNADSGWQPEPAVSDWALTVSAAEGRAEYTADTRKAGYALAAAAVLALLALLALPGRRAGA